MKRALVVAAVLIAAACGSKSTAPTTTDNTLSAPGSFAITLQQVFLASNTIAFSWNSTGASTYKFMAGSASGLSDVFTADVTGTSYTWTAPRTANIYYVRVAAISGGQTGTASTELPIFTIDMRYVIDALFFSYGPMSDNIGVQPPGSAPAAIWADNSAVNVIVTDEAGSVTLDAAKVFVTDYLAATSNHISVNFSTTSATNKGVSLGSIPLNTVIIRVDNTICPQVGIIACANIGPQPVGLGRSFVNLNLAPQGANIPGSTVAISHEVGHAFGFFHLKVNNSNRPELRFLMNPALLVSQLSDVEKNAIAAARAGGLRANSTRAQAVAAGLVFATANPASMAAPVAILPTIHDIVESAIIK